jgi:hypothetical protein
MHQEEPQKGGEVMKEATCSKCGDIYNPEEFGELHFDNNCNGKPINEIQYN